MSFEIISTVAFNLLHSFILSLFTLFITVFFKVRVAAIEKTGMISPEITGIFIQIREKMIEGITSAVYYESKTLEILSLISQRHCLKQQYNYENTY